MDERTELAQALAELVRAPESMLSRVFIQRDSMTMRYTVTAEDGTVLMVINHEHLREGQSVEEAIRAKFHSLVCADCNALLLDGESGLCGLCEARTVMDLLHMSKALS